MAHARQEFTFELIGALHFAVARFQFPRVSVLHLTEPGFGESALADVPDNRGDPESVFGFDRAETDLYWEGSSVFTARAQIQRCAHGTRHRMIPIPRSVLHMARPHRFRNQRLDGLAQQLLALVAERSLGCLIQQRDSPL